MKKRGIFLVIALAVLLVAHASANTAPIFGDINDELLLCEGSATSYVTDVNDAEAAPLEVGIFPASPFFIRSFPSQTATTRLEIFSANLTKSQANKIYEQTLFVSDGEFVDTKKVKFTVLEKNNPPIISPVGVQTVTFADNFTFTKQVQLTDIESGDIPQNFMFNISSSPELPITISREGVISLIAQYDDQGVYTVTVCATDTGIPNLEEKIGVCSEGEEISEMACSQFQLVLATENAAPTILLYNSTNVTKKILGTETLFFEVYTFDPEGSITDIYWYVDGQPVQQSAGTTSDRLLYSFGCNLGGRHNVKVDVTDGLLNDSFQWAFDIIKTPCQEGIAPGGVVGNKSCTEVWGCEMWNPCQNVNQSLEIGIISLSDFHEIQNDCTDAGISSQSCGFQIRTCTDAMACNSSINKPTEIRTCAFVLEPSCEDSVRNCHGGSCEILADCGGPCTACPTCTDGIQNQGEERADCEGPCTNQCPARLVSEEEKNLKRNITIAILVFSCLAFIQIGRIMKVKKRLDAPPKHRSSNEKV